MKRVCLTILLAVFCLLTGFGLGLAHADSRTEVQPAEVTASGAVRKTVDAEPEKESSALQTEPEETGETMAAPDPSGETGRRTDAAAAQAAADAVTISEVPIPYMEWNGIVRLCQQDRRWASERYSRKNVGLGGCGLVSLSRALTYATGKELSPLDLIDMETPYGLKYRYASHLGTDSNLYKDWAGQLNVSTLRTANANVARFEMETRGAVAVTLVKGGSLSAAGHYVLLVELDDSQAVILDPTIEGIMRTPEGVVTNLAVTSHASEYILVYPVGTELPTQEEFWDYTLKLPHEVDKYPEVRQAMLVHETGTTEETAAMEAAA